MAAKISRSYRISDEADRMVKDLAGRLQKSEGDVIELAVSGLFTADKADLRELINRWFRETWARLDEILETVQTVQPEPPEPMERGPSFSPASIPGVQVGAANLRPARESGNERAQREAREREQRARARSSVGDDPSVCFDPEFVQE